MTDTNALHTAGEHFVQVSSYRDDIIYTVFKPAKLRKFTCDLKIEKLDVRHYNSEMTIAKVYYFDYIDLPICLLLPELLTIIINRVFRSVKTAEGYKLIVKSKYENHRYLAPKSQPDLPVNLCIPLTSTLLNCCEKFANIRKVYAPLGKSPHESLEQQIENFIRTGRAHRILGAYPREPSLACTVDTIIKENIDTVPYRTLFVGSFPCDEEAKYIPEREQWLYVAID